MKLSSPSFHLFFFRGKGKSSGRLPDQELPNPNMEDKMTNSSDDKTLSSVLK